MTEASNIGLKLKLLIFSLVGIGVIVFDQITKLICMKNMELEESVAVIPGALNFTYIRNEGAAFGSLSNARWIFMIASVVMIMAIIGYVIYDKSLTKAMTVTLAMIAGGGVGNMIDRIAYGYVVDFIDVKLFSFWKWIFNVADSFVCVGAALLLVLFLAYEIKNKKEKKNDVNTEL